MISGSSTSSIEADFKIFYFELSLNYNTCIFAEIMNLRNLERVLAREEEVKKRAIVHKAVYNGPQIRYYSKDGKLSFYIIMFCFKC